LGDISGRIGIVEATAPAAARIRGWSATLFIINGVVQERQMSSKDVVHAQGEENDDIGGCPQANLEDQPNGTTDHHPNQLADSFGGSFEGLKHDLDGILGPSDRQPCISEGVVEERDTDAAKHDAESGGGTSKSSHLLFSGNGNKGDERCRESQQLIANHSGFGWSRDHGREHRRHRVVGVVVVDHYYSLFVR